MNRSGNTLEMVKWCLEESGLSLEGVSLILGLSGGSDSVALLLILKDLSAEYGFHITAVHVDHGIRPEASRLRDLSFCKELCERLGVPFVSFTEPVPEQAKEQHLTLEEAGRLIRYKRFEELREKLGADYIVTAHHLDDQEETILLHLLRGCGLKGLCGMEVYDPARKLLRPLLSLRKEELEAYLTEKGQSFVTDETNLEDEAVRNRIRHQVIPAIRQAVPEYSGKSLAGSAGIFREMEQDYTDRAQRWIRGHLSKEEDGKMTLRLWEPSEEAPSLPLRSYIIRECIRMVSGSAVNVGEVHLAAIRELMEGGTGRMQIWPGGGRVIRSYGELIFLAEDPKEGKQVDGGLTVALQEVTGAEAEAFRADPAHFSQNTCFQYVDCDRIIGRLWIRTRRPGDVFATGKDGKRKKLQDVLVDLKVPAHEREELLLVGLEEHEVIWIVGRRLSPYYFVRPETVHMGRLEIREEENDPEG